MNEPVFGTKKKYRCEEPKVEEEMVELPSFLTPTFLEVVNNRIYFYSDVSRESVLQLNKTLHSLSNDIITHAQLAQGTRDSIFLHINSNGGELFSGMAAVDHILNTRKHVNVYSIIDGLAASAASLMSIVATKRFMNKHSRILIHQLSSQLWGKYSEIEDEKLNLDNNMKTIREIYLQYTKIPKSKLNEILKHDIFFDATECLEYGLVDEIYG